MEVDPSTTSVPVEECIKTAHDQVSGEELLDSTNADSFERLADRPNEENVSPPAPESEATAETIPAPAPESEATEETIPAPAPDTAKQSEVTEVTIPAPAPDSAKQSDVAEIPIISTLEEKIIRQIEFYFGDRNYPRDKHLQQAVSADAHGWVPITYLLNFNRLKELSTDVQCIYTALRKATAGVVEVKEGEFAVRRNTAKPASLIRSKEESHEIKAKSVSVKEFPLDAKFDEIQQFFDNHGKIKYIQMRRTVAPERKFKGSVFVEFETKADADKFLSHSSVQYQGKELFRESKEAYYVRQKEKQTAKKGEGKPDEMGEEKADVKGEEEKPDKQPAAPKSDASITKGAILHFKGCGETTSREDIKEACVEFADVAWIDFSKGCTEGYVRCKESGGAQKLLEGLTAAGGQLNGADSVFRVLKDEEEMKYWSEQVGQHSKGGRGRGRGNGGRGRGGRGGRGGGGRNWKGQKRRQNYEDSGRPDKQQKKETEIMDE